MVRRCWYTAAAAQAKAQVLSTFISNPHSPVEPTVTISMTETTSETPAAAKGPKRKPAMQMMTSFRSKLRKPRTLMGMSLERYMTT